MRLALVVILALGCKDKTQTAAPRPGSAIVAAPSPRKSAALDATKLSQVDVAGWTRDVRQADRRGIEVRYGADAIAVTVQIAPCFDCVPMQLERWQAKSDALRALIVPELRDHASTTWELGITQFGDQPVIWTYYAGDTGALAGAAFALHYNDGAHMIRVVAEASGDGSRAAVTKSRLEAAARVFLDELTRRWG